MAGGFGPAWTLVRIADQKAFRFESGLEDPGSWKVGQTSDGRTLLLFNQQRLQLVSYELP